MVAIRFTALAALAIAAPLNALLFSTAPHRGVAKRLANANPVPAPVEVGLDYYRALSTKAKRAGPGKAAHCAARHRGKSSSASSAQATPTANSNEAAQDTVAEVKTTTTTPAAVTTTRARPTTTQRTTTKATTTPKAATTTPASSGSSNSSDDGLTDSQQATFLSLHNSIRSEHGAAALTWSSDLAAAAKGWADKCVFQHSGGSLGPYGENLAAGTGSAYDVSAAMKSWTDEIKDYSSSNPVPSHYTQVVWKGTKQVGCALAPACGGIFDASYGTAKYFVCEYFPAGNVIGQFAANVL